jgi:ectoine hydroxylase-related dioxygenase (phytanoyl-CoA dioxygenase family)
MIVRVSCKKNPHWLDQALSAVDCVGFAVVEDVLDAAFLAQTCERMYAVRDAILRAVGYERLARAGEMGVLRLMMLYDPFFLRFLEVPEMIAFIDATISNTAILHTQNGFVLPSHPRANTPKVAQNSYHMDFRRVLNGCCVSVNALFAITEFRADNGATIVVPGSHQLPQPPSLEFLAANGTPLECPAGAMMLFDSTLWHAAGPNYSGADRLGLNQQFTRSYFKQQIDYPRALGLQAVIDVAERTKQLLGYFTRVPSSLEEYYRPPDERLYRAGQG